LTDIPGQGHFLYMCSAESKVLTALWTKFSNASIDSGFCYRPVLCIVHRIFFYIGVMFVGLPSSEAVRIADNESMGQNPNTRIHHQKGTSMLNTSFTKTNTIFGQALGCTALDDAFVKLLSDVNAGGVTQFLVRTNGKEKMKTVAQVNSESLEAGVRERIFDKVSPKYGTPTYWDTSTNIYFSINTFHPQKSLRGKGIRRKADVEKLRMLFFDIDCHDENAPADISDRISELVLDAVNRHEIPDCAISNSGRGVGLFVFLEPCNPNSLSYGLAYSGVHRAISLKLNELIEKARFTENVELDKAVHETNRVARLPGTYNTKAKRCCHCIRVPEGKPFDLLKLADQYEVPYRFADEKVAPSDANFNKTDDEILDWAKKRFAAMCMRYPHLLDALNNYKEKEARKANFVCRFELALRYLQANPCGEGNRHNTLLAVLSTCYDRGGHPDMDKAQLINRTFSQPLSDKEVAHLVSTCKYPCKNSTIEALSGIPASALKNPKAEGKKDESKPKRYEKGEIPPPIASSKADRYMLGVLINHGIIPDYRIRNHRQKYEAQERRKKRMVIYDRIPELYASGLSAHAIAKELKISVPTVYEQAKVRGLDIVEKEQQAFRVKNLTAQRLVEMGYQKQKVAELMGVNRNTVFNALNRSFDFVSEEDLMLVDKAVNKLVGHVTVIVETPEPQTADELETAKPQEANEATVTAETAETVATAKAANSTETVTTEKKDSSKDDNKPDDNVPFAPFSDAYNQLCFEPQFHKGWHSVKDALNNYATSCCSAISQLWDGVGKVQRHFDYGRTQQVAT
jgi:DNA-binding CsgD family transcriptional regulator